MTTWLFEPAADVSPRDVLHITIRLDGELTVCALTGPLCAYTAPTLDQWLRQLEENDRHRVIVDVSDVDAVSSDGVDVLLHHATRCRAVGGAFQLRGASAVARRVLELCGAGHLVEAP